MRWILTAAFLVATLAAATQAADAGHENIERVSLTHSDCLGYCPSYQLTLYANGCMHLHGQSNFVLIGDFTSNTGGFQEVVNALESHQFFGLRPAYPVLKKGYLAIVDGEVATLTVAEKGGVIRRVSAASGGEKDTIAPGGEIPESFQELVHIIDGLGLDAYWFDDSTGKPAAPGRAGEDAPKPRWSKGCGSQG